MLFSPRKIDKILPKPRFSKPIFGHPAGSTKLDRPYCKQFRVMSFFCLQVLTPAHLRLIGGDVEQHLVPLHARKQAALCRSMLFELQLRCQGPPKTEAKNRERGNRA